jgi:ABC-type sugar transport system substrate-binding protein
VSGNGFSWTKRTWKVPLICSLIVLLTIGVVACGGSGSSSTDSTGSSEAAAAEGVTASNEEGGQSEGELVAISQKLASAAEKGYVTAPPAGYLPPEEIEPVTKFPSPMPYTIPSGAKKHKVTVLRCEPVLVCGRMGVVITALFHKLGWEVEQLTPTFNSTETTTQSFNKIFSQAVAEKPEVIVSLGLSAAQNGHQIEEANNAGIKTVLVTSGKETGEGFDVYIPDDYNLQRELTAAWMVGDSEGSADALVYGIEGAAQFWSATASEFLSGCADCTINEANIPLEACFNPSSMAQVVSSDLRRYPESEYMLAPSTACQVPGIERAKEETGSEVKLAEMGEAVPETVEWLESGAIQATAFVPVEWPAFAAVDAAVRAAEGQPLPKESEYKFGIGLWTEANYPKGSPDFAEIYEASLKRFNYAAPYAKAWGLSEAELLIPEEEEQG